MIENPSNVANSPQEPLTIEDLQRAIELLKSASDPLADFMRSKGFDPDAGCLLVIPIEVYWDWGEYSTPEYVRVSPRIDQPVLIKGHKYDYS
jgi:hypothetical protein